VDSAGTASFKGSLLTSTGHVSIAAIDDEIMVVDGSKGYTYIVSTGTYAQISDSDFPSGAKVVTAQDSYFIVVKDATGQFYISSLNDGQTWSALDFATAEGGPDNLVTCISDRRELWLLGERTTEIWTNTGGSFPFERVSGIFIQHGCAARFSLAQGDNTLFWLAKNRAGQGYIVRTDGVSVQVVSNRAITEEINDMSTIDDAFAYVYQQDGHEFYVITFPTEDKTFAYDASTGQWHKRSSFDTVNQDYGRHLSNNHAFCYGNHLVGDYSSGKIYKFNTNTYTDNGETIIRKIISPPIFNNNQFITLHQLEINLKKAPGLVSGQGDDPQVMVRISKDGGRTWGNTLFRSAGKIGEYDTNVIYNRLGTTKSAFTIEMTVSDPVEWVVLGATADVEKQAIDTYDQAQAVPVRST
jgi:hypothetical protein